MLARNTVFRWASAVSASAFLLGVVLSATALGGQVATAAEPVQWGPQGTITGTSSAVTVRWDNTGNTPADTVARDSSQVIPHTGGKTYADVPANVAATYASNFGKDDGLGGLSVTVSQTANLVDQAVNLQVSGAKGGSIAGGGTRLFVMQCWGAPTASGAPDPNAAAPDPETCQEGLGGADLEPFASPDLRSLDSNDPLVAGGDWSTLANAPFQAVDGTKLATLDTDNPYFNKSTTNEFSQFNVDSSGSGSRPFEIQTGVQAPGLGCGFRADAPSVRSCWLVVVPFPPAAQLQADGFSPGIDSGLTPSLWAQRLQVKLGMQNVASSCPGGQAQTLSIGSEVLPAAMASWIPAICASKKIALGYTSAGDAQARQQLTTGGQNLIYTTAPVAGGSTTLYAPIALGAVTIALSWDNSGTGAPLDDVKLNARLVAKLLTESYLDGVDGVQGTQIDSNAPWVTKVEPRGLIHDPEFVKLNPTFTHDITENAGDSGDLVVSTVNSDAAAAVWQWILNDPDGKAFLDGCPDSNGMVINPFYSTRSYTECSGQAAALEATAAAERSPLTLSNPDGTTLPSTYEDQPMVYPPDGSIFPQPGWYERGATVQPDGSVSELALTLPDLHARANAMADVGRSVFRATYPANTTWCNFALTGDQTCTPAPGVWKSSATPQLIGHRDVLGLTTSSTAAQFQVPTAQLCNDSGSSCVGADSASLEKAANGFGTTATAGVAAPATKPDYAGGAYPLTIPVYAAIATSGLSKTDATTFAGVLGFLSTSGQVPGLAPGNLPPGYAPMTASMVTQTRAAITELSSLTHHTSPADTVPQTSLLPDEEPPVPGAPEPTPSPTATPQPAMAEAGAKTPATPIGLPEYSMLIGLGAAVVAGLVSPVVSRKRKKVVR